MRLYWHVICLTQAFRHKYYYLMMQIMSKWCKGKFSIGKKEEHSSSKIGRKYIKIIKMIIPCIFLIQNGIFESTPIKFIFNAVSVPGE